MSKTPLTDAMTAGCHFGPFVEALADHARRMEVERDEARLVLEDEQLVAQAREFLSGVNYALSLVRDADTCGIRAVTAKCPESYRRGQQDAIRAITTYLYPNNKIKGTSQL